MANKPPPKPINGVQFPCSKLCLSITVVIVSVVGAFITAKLSKMGVWYSARSENPYDMACKIVDSAFNISSEDIQHLNGTVYFATGDRRGFMHPNANDAQTAAMMRKTKSGALYYLDLELDKEPRKFVIRGYRNRTMHLHGLYAFKDESERGGDGSVYLYTVNHRVRQEVVSVFRRKESDDDTLYHVESISHPLFRALNDVVVLNRNEFLVTQWLSDEYGTSKAFWDALLEKPTCDVLHCVRREGATMILGRNSDEKDWDCRVALEGLKGPNGITKTKDGKLLFVVEGGRHQLLSFVVTPPATPHSFSQLTRKSAIPIAPHCDNINIIEEREDSVVAGLACHPSVFQFLAHARHNSSLAPSELLLLTIPDKDYETPKTEVALRTARNGPRVAHMSSLSVLEVVGRGEEAETWFGGAVFQGGYLLCVKDSTKQDHPLWA